MHLAQSVSPCWEKVPMCLLTTGSDHNVESGVNLNRRRIFNGNVQTVIPSSSRYIARITLVVAFTDVLDRSTTIVIFVLLQIDAVGIVHYARFSDNDAALSTTLRVDFSDAAMTKATSWYWADIASSDMGPANTVDSVSASSMWNSLWKRGRIEFTQMVVSNCLKNRCVNIFTKTNSLEKRCLHWH